MRERGLILPTHTPEVNRFINNVKICKGNMKVNKHRWEKQVHRARSFYNALCTLLFTFKYQHTDNSFIIDNYLIEIRPN